MVENIKSGKDIKSILGNKNSKKSKKIQFSGVDFLQEFLNNIGSIDGIFTISGNLDLEFKPTSQENNKFIGDYLISYETHYAFHYISYSDIEYNKGVGHIQKAIKYYDNNSNF